MSFASLRRVLRSARKGLCSTCGKTKHPQLEAAGAGHVGCLMYTFETLGQVMKDEHDVTAVHVAARKGQISILIYLIENDHVEGVPRAKNGATPAHDAAGTGNLECLKYILSRTKASAMDKDSNQATPLHWAVQSGHFKVVQWLVLHANASIDSTANNGITPFHIAAAKNYHDILRWLTGHAYRNHPKPRRIINAKDKNGATPLYHASHAGHLKVIQWLAEKGGGDPTIFTTQGLAPLHAATIGGHLGCVSYLFRFGSATAPGGLRSTEGASALHYAAADGHVDIIKWLLQQKDCAGNERDYYQCTPLHDAAEHGHLRAVQILCDGGADHLLTDIEGNFPKDLAEKHHHNKCAKYLAARERNKTWNNSTKDSALNRGLKRQQNASKAQMIDSYRNAPPHQRPVSVFEEEDDEDLDSIEGDGQWETLHDLMDESELENLTPAEINSTVSSADRKRRELEENMRQEAEERKKKKKELLIWEKEYEKEIRDRLLAEEPLDDREMVSPNKLKSSKKGKKHRKSERVNKAPHSDVRRLSLPASLTNDSITERGIVEKRTWEFESRSPVVTASKGTFLSKLWPGKKGSATSDMKSSQSWESGTISAAEYLPVSPDSLHVINDKEDNLPPPPPLPTLEYLLGRRPAYLRGKGHASREQSSSQDTKYRDDEHNSDRDSDHSSVSSTQSDQKSQQKKKAKKKKRRSSKEDDTIDWQYNKLTVPQSSPHRERKGLARRPTPRPAESGYPGQMSLSSAFDEVNRELEMGVPSDSPSSLSPLHSPSPQSPVGSPNNISPSPSHTQIIGQLNYSNGHLLPKHTAPLLPPKQQIKLGINGLSKSPDAVSKRTTPISLKDSSRKAPTRQQIPQINESENQTPAMFMADFNQAMKTSSSPPPRVMRQLASPAGHYPSPINIIGVQAGRQQPTQADSESDSSEYTSSSDDSSSSTDGSSTEESSDEESGFVRAQVPKRPVMARNIGMGSHRRGLGGVNRAKLMARYPRLLRKKPIRLTTIEEVPEEIVHEAESYDAKAMLFRRVMSERKIMKAWRKYMQIMKTIYRKAEKMAQRKRRDVLAKVFYAWVQVRNLGAVMKDDIDRAITYHDKRLMKRVFNAWYFTKFGAKMPIARSTSMQLMTAELEYIDWLNEQLPQTQAVDNISESLADGTLILKALSAAIGKKAPKHNSHPRVQLHRQDNWKVAHGFMASAGINVKGIEPADLGNVNPAAIHNMFVNILKWDEKRTQTTLI